MVYAGVPSSQRGRTRCPSVVVPFSMVCEITTFVSAIRGDAVAVEKVAALERTTLDSLYVMDEIRSQAGVRFPADDAL